MIFASLDEILECKEDFSALGKLQHKNKRQQNRKQIFKAPLMVSAHQLKHLNKIDTLFCDAVIINLEDGVAVSQKPKALAYALIFISHLQKSDKKIIVRVNALNEGGKEEIQALNSVFPDAIRVPKIRSKEDVLIVETLVSQNIDIHLSIETAQAWHQLSDLKTSTRVSHFYLGVLDLLADLGLSQSIITLDNPTLHYLLAHFLISCRSIDVEPVSFVFQEHQNDTAFKAWIDLEQSMGFKAKGVISPNQAKAMMEQGINSQEIQRAQHIVKRFEAMQIEGVTGFVDETYGFIDEPIYKGALVVLDLI